jgi:hypothetical protein
MRAMQLSKVVLFQQGYELVHGAFERSMPFVRNAWVPKPGPALRRLPRLFSMYYFKKILSLQTCPCAPGTGGNVNRFHRSAINVTAPPGVRRSEYEAGLRARVEKALDYQGAGDIVRFMLATPVGLTVFALLVALILLAARSTSDFVIILLIAVASAGVISFLGTSFLDLIRNTSVNIFVDVMVIAAGAWAARNWVNPADYKNITHLAKWQIGVSAALVMCGASVLIGLIAAILEIRWTLRYYSRNLDGVVILNCLAIYHSVTVHKSNWGERDQQKEIADELLIIADRIQHYLPRWLKESTGKRRGEVRSLAYQIAEPVRIHTDDLLKSDGRKSLIEFVNLYVSRIYQGEWFELPRVEREREQEARLRIAHFLRPLSASLIPAALMLFFHVSHVLAAGYETYGWLFAALWFAASIGAWIDPDLGERLKVLNIVTGLFRPKSE